MRTQPLRLRREFVQKDNPRIRTDDYPYNAKRRGVSFSRAFLNAIAPRPSATPDESPDRVGPSCLRWAHLCLLCAQFKPEETRTVAGHPAHPCIVPKRGSDNEATRIGNGPPSPSYATIRLVFLPLLSPAQIWANACSRSAMRSSASSRPTDSQIGRAHV